MHDAFQLFPVLEQLPVQVESLAAIGDRLLIGTSRGQLLVYKVQNRTNDGVSIRLVDTKKSFAKQAIKQLEVIKEAGLLIALADDVVSLFDLQTYSPSMKLSNTKGAQLMITHTEIDHIKEIPVLVSKLCVVTRKKIIVFEWRDAQYHEYKEYPFSERIRSVQFATPNLLLIATSREFTSLHLPLGQWIDLFSADAASLRTAAKSRGGLGGTLAPPIKEMPASSPTSGGGNSGGGWGSWTRGFIGGGGSAAPMVVRMPNEELLLCREDIGVFITHAGKLSRNHNGPVSFPSVPINITYYSPLYLITTEKRATEDRTGSYWVVVRSVVDHSLIQELELGPEQSPCAAINGVNGKQVWIASASTVWYLLPVDIHKQVEQVLRGQDFEQAHNLIAQADNILEEERTQLIQKVQWLHARWLFSEEAEYERALDIFSELNATPTEAIAL
ncbi:Vacuolar morphogenesis protein 6, partial [Spiromyces aspiralis]